MSQQSPRGAVLLFIVLVVGTAGFVAVTVLARTSLDSLLDANEAHQAWAVRAKARGCLDEVLIQLRKSDAYAPATVSTDVATCTLTVTTPGAGQRVVTVALTEQNITRRLHANVTLQPFAVTLIDES